jgi:hypothetical protein
MLEKCQTIGELRKEAEASEDPRIPHDRPVGLLSLLTGSVRGIALPRSTEFLNRSTDSRIVWAGCFYGS